MRNIYAKLVPKNLLVEQKANRLEICEDLVGKLETEPDFLDKVITRDELWVFDYDLETKRQIAEWHMKSSPCPKKANMRRARVKTIIIVFFNSYGIVHKEFVPPGQLITPSTKCLGTTSKAGPVSPNGHSRRLGAAPLLRASSHCAFNLRISGEEKHSRTSTSFPQPMRFLPPP